jgi:RimJ/RimL family protein N-acetyltransferase
VTDAVQLLEIDDVVAAQLRGERDGSLRLAPGFPRTEDLEAVRAYERGGLAYAVLVDDLVVGTCGSHGPPTDVGTIELGWGLVEAARGQGVGTTAVAGLLDATVRRYPTASIVAHTEWRDDGGRLVADSEASEAILRRLGFVSAAPPLEPGYRAWRLPGS